MALPFIGPASLNPQQGGGGGITTIKMNPAQVRFPTSRRPAPQRRPLEPTNVEKFAPLAPLLMEGIFSAFKKEPERLTNEQYLQSIGADPQDPSKLEQTQLDAYNLYGPRAEPNTFGMDEIANIVAAGLSGRGAKDYANTYLNLRKAKGASDARTNTARSSYISTQMTPRNQSVLLMDTIAAEAGDTANMYYTGQYDPTLETFFYLNPETQEFEDIRESGKNLVQSKSFLEGGDANPFLNKAKNAALTEYSTALSSLTSQQTAATNSIGLIGDFVDLVDQNPDDPSPVSIITKGINIANDALQNFDDFATVAGGGKSDNYFADFADTQGDNPIAGSNGRGGTGDNAKNLYNAIRSGNDEQIEIALKRFEEDNSEYLDQIDFREGFRDLAFSGTKANRILLSLAYQVAAANGQTGRTLSDKDLAYHLKIVGFGATQDVKNLRRNLLEVGDMLVRTVDENAQTIFDPILNNEVSEYVVDPSFVRGWQRLYQGLDKDGNPWQQRIVDPQNPARAINNPIAPAKFVYKSYFERYKNLDSVNKFQNYNRPGSAKNRDKNANQRLIDKKIQIDTSLLFD